VAAGCSRLLCRIRARRYRERGRYQVGLPQALQAIPSRYDRAGPEYRRRRVPHCKFTRIITLSISSNSVLQMKEAYEVLGDGERKEKYDKGDYQEWIRYRDEVENYENPIDYQRERAYWVEETVERHERKKQKKDEERERLAQREASHRAAVDQWRKEQNWQERVDREQVRQFAMEQEDFLHAEAVALRTA